MKSTSGKAAARRRGVGRPSGEVLRMSGTVAAEWVLPWCAGGADRRTVNELHLGIDRVFRGRDPFEKIVR